MDNDIWHDDNAAMVYSLHYMNPKRKYDVLVVDGKFFFLGFMTPMAYEGLVNLLILIQHISYSALSQYTEKTKWFFTIKLTSEVGLLWCLLS